MNRRVPYAALLFAFGTRRGQSLEPQVRKERLGHLRKPVAGLSETALTRFVSRASRAGSFEASVNVLVTGSAELRALNRRFRGKDQPTDVLSFPPGPGFANGLAGDIAISADIAKQNASRLGHSAAQEIKILALHGVLHLAGFDHERDQRARWRARKHDCGGRWGCLRLIERNVRKSTKRVRAKAAGGSPATTRARRTDELCHRSCVAPVARLLTLVSYVDRLYTEIGKFLSREFQDNIDAFEQKVEPRLRVSRERAALSMAVLTQLTTAAIALLVGFAVFRERGWGIDEILQATLSLVLIIIMFNRFLPFVFFSRTEGEWLARWAPVLRILIYLVLPVTLVLGFLHSVTALTKEHADEHARDPGGSGRCPDRGRPGRRHPG